MFAFYPSFFFSFTLILLFLNSYYYIVLPENVKTFSHFKDEKFSSVIHKIATFFFYQILEIYCRRTTMFNTF
ncbi:MAG TPA: hypothetical protein DDY31_13380 [Lachnospiraceae bacterium]|nr:hypothetical protein [Lachnospiraceae bacterium]